MTLICWDGKTVAADGQYSYDTMRASGRLPKLRQVGDRVFGFTGATALFDPMIKWFLGGHDPDAMPKGDEDDNDSRLLVFEDGACVSYKPKLPYPEPCFWPDAWGCCADYAIGCLDSGKSTAETVELAILRYSAIGGPIQVIDLHADMREPISPEAFAEMKTLAEEIDIQNARRLLEEAGYVVGHLNEALRDALKPFDAQNLCEAIAAKNFPDDSIATVSVTLGDLRRARAALSASDANPGTNSEPETGVAENARNKPGEPLP